MKISQSAALSSNLTEESVRLGQLLAQLRVSRRLKQMKAAELAGISRSSAYRIEWGDSAVSFGQILRYLHAIAPDMALKDLLNQPLLHMAPARQVLTPRRVCSRRTEPASSDF